MSGGHTPGPWVANRERFIKAENGWTIAQVRGPSGRGKEFVEGLPFCDANARLIAAAPDMLAACESMIPSGVCLTNSNIPDTFVVCLDVPMGELRKIAAAISKATGAA